MAKFTLYLSIYTWHATEYEEAGGAVEIYIDRINY